VTNFAIFDEYLATMLLSVKDISVPAVSQNMVVLQINDREMCWTNRVLVVWLQSTQRKDGNGGMSHIEDPTPPRWPFNRGEIPFEPKLSVTFLARTTGRIHLTFVL
jgi:hypothetical protein